MLLKPHPETQTLRTQSSFSLSLKGCYPTTDKLKDLVSGSYCIIDAFPLKS